jgi:hypothetical protein
MALLNGNDCVVKTNADLLNVRVRALLDCLFRPREQLAARGRAGLSGLGDLGQDPNGRGSGSAAGKRSGISPGKSRHQKFSILSGDRCSYMALTTSGVATALSLRPGPQSSTRISTRPNGRSSIRWRTASAASESGNTLAIVGWIALSDR